jgi:hypothetical protein
MWRGTVRHRSAAKPQTFDSSTDAQADREPIQRLIIPAETLQSGVETLPGGDEGAQCRFRPTRRGEPVAVLVTMEIAFALR